MRCTDQAKSRKRRFVNLVFGKDYKQALCAWYRSGGEVVLGGLCKMVGL